MKRLRPACALVALAGLLLAACSSGPSPANLRGDAGGASDGGGLGSDDSDGLAADPCLRFGRALFCDDFDVGTPGQRWDAMDMSPLASVQLTRRAPRSGTSSFRAQVLSGGARALLKKTVAFHGPANATVRVALRPQMDCFRPGEIIPPITTIDLGLVAASGAAHVLQVALDDAVLILREVARDAGGADTVVNELRMLPLKFYAWNAVSLAVEGDVGQVDVDGVKMPFGLAQPAADVQGLTLAIGIDAQRAPFGCTYDYDDVALDATAN